MIFPVILTGGSGTRLWPVSRASFPKQFQSFDGGPTLLQHTAQRVTGDGFAAPVIMTGEPFRFIAEDQLAEIGVVAHLTLVEPQGRNTAPAILAATLALTEDTPDALILVVPADHHIPDVAAFQAMVQRAVPAAQDGQIVTFGVTPDRPETGFGYLEVSDPTPQDRPVALTRFVEKPDAANADRFVAAGTYLWNAGIFLFRADVMIQAFATHAPDMVPLVQTAFDLGEPDLNFQRLAPGPWAQVDSISIDYAIMEKCTNLVAGRFDGHWSDLGAWDAIWRQANQDAHGVAVVGNAHSIESHDSLIYATPDGPGVVGMGLTNTIVVATKDAVLVADASKAQDIKSAVQTLETTGQIGVSPSPREYRPWGWYETLALGGRFQVKRIVVNPGGVLSLQSHHHRAEHWVVVQGTAQVTLGDTVELITENQSVYIPVGTVHRLQNPGKFPMTLIEVQTGGYLGEDDIVRYADIYDRG
ncbi:MAG: mannose-1-phosphate guanylyltransferase/mannose-6-phosphate isomerase [Pseudomonadota bacterium]